MDNPCKVSTLPSIGGSKLGLHKPWASSPSFHPLGKEESAIQDYTHKITNPWKTPGSWPSKGHYLPTFGGERAQSRETPTQTTYPNHAPQVGEHVSQGVQSLEPESPDPHPCVPTQTLRLRQPWAGLAQTRSGGRLPTIPTWEQG